MSTPDFPSTPVGVGLTPAEPAPLPQLTSTESRDSRRSRLSTGSLLAAFGLVLAWLVTQTHGDVSFALSDFFDEVQLPTFTGPGLPVVATGAAVCLLAAAGYLTGLLKGRSRAWAGAIAATLGLIAFLSWAVAGLGMPFLIANQFNGTLAFATPLVFGAMAGVLGERAGVVNIAIEGQLLAGAFTSALVGTITQNIAAGMLAAAFAGVLVSFLLGLFAIRYLVDHVVLGVVLNMLVAGLTGFLFDALMKGELAARFNKAPILEPIAIPGLSAIPLLGRVLFEQTILAYLGFISVAVIWFLLFRTKWGLRVRSVGEHPRAADTVGIPVHRVQWSAILIGGFFAGMGGVFYTMGSTGSFDKGMTAGAGYIALAAVIMGRWHPVKAALMALFFGFVTQMSSQLSSMSAPLPSDLLLMLPYIATVVAVAGLIGRVRAPAHDGVAYVK